MPGVPSCLRWGRGDQDFAGVRLVAHDRGAVFGFPGFRGGGLGGFIGLVALAMSAAMLRATAILLLLALRLLALLLLALLLHGGRGLVLLGRLIHRVQNAEIVLRMLEIAFGLHAVAAAGRVAAKLEVFFEQLLGRTAQPYVRAVAIENVIAVQRYVATRIRPDGRGSPATATSSAISSAASTARAMIAATHAFHVHVSAVVLSRCGRNLGRAGRNRKTAPRSHAHTGTFPK